VEGFGGKGEAEREEHSAIRAHRPEDLKGKRRARRAEIFPDGGGKESCQIQEWAKRNGFAENMRWNFLRKRREPRSKARGQEKKLRRVPDHKPPTGEKDRYARRKKRKRPVVGEYFSIGGGSCHVKFVGEARGKLFPAIQGNLVLKAETVGAERKGFKRGQTGRQPLTMESKHSEGYSEKEGKCK